MLKIDKLIPTVMLYVACIVQTSVFLLLFQQLTRSQQMDELLDVLIESGGKMTFNIGTARIAPIHLFKCFILSYLPLEAKNILYIR